MRLWRISKCLFKFIFIWVVFLLIISLTPAVIGIITCQLSVNKPTFNLADSQIANGIKSSQEKIPGYCRPMASTFLTFPEWYIVYSSREYAHFLIANNPSDFPYFSSIEQYWCGYRAVYELSKSYPFNLDDHIMLSVIGMSFSAEYVLKGLYENSVGRFTEWLSDNEKTAEDIYAQKVAQDYVDFIPLRPWFEFPFNNSLYGLWHETSWSGSHMIRKWERKIILSVEYSVKAIYGWLIGMASHATLGAASDYVYATIYAPTDKLANLPDIKIMNRIDNHLYIISLPYEQALTNSIQYIASANLKFVDIACNQAILLTFIVPKDWQADSQNGAVLFTMPILTDPTSQRMVVLVPVTDLLTVVNRLNKNNILIEHVYGY